MNAPVADSLPGLLEAWLSEPDDELGRFLKDVRQTLLRHPVAAQSAFSALAAEGRRFAATPAGARWQERLAGSELIRRGRDIWEVATLNMLSEGTREMLPTQFVEAFCYAASLADLEPRLARASEPVVTAEEDEA